MVFLIKLTRCFEELTRLPRLSNIYIHYTQCFNFPFVNLVAVYVLRRRTELVTDFSESLSIFKKKLIDTPRVIVYCRTLMIYADAFSHFSYDSATELSENRLFDMFHAKYSSTQQRCNYQKFARLSWYC